VHGPGSDFHVFSVKLKKAFGKNDIFQEKDKEITRF